MWIAASDPPLVELLQWGPAGIVIVAFVTGYIWAKPAVERLQKDLDAALSDLREVRREQRETEHINREVVIPAIIKFVEIGERIQERLGETVGGTQGLGDRESLPKARRPRDPGASN